MASVYRAAAGEQLWGDALTAITQDLGVMGCQMIGISSNTGAVVFSHAARGVPAEIELEYVRTYHKLDPRIPLLLSSKPGEWLYDEDVFDDRFAVTNSYYKDLLIPYGSRYTASAKLLDQDGEIVLIAFLSRLGLDGFSAYQRQALDALCFHLRNATAIYRKTRRLMVVAVAGSELLNRLRRPAFLLSMDRSVSFMNDAAQEHLGHSQVLGLRLDRLIALDVEAERELCRGFECVLLGTRAGEASRRVIVRLRRRGGAAAVVASLTALLPAETMHAFGNLPQVLVLLHERESRTMPDVLLWEAAYSLTPGQSRVALAVYQGHTIKEAAKSLRIAETTVRTHLREVFAKTDTRRQAHLIQALSALEY